MPESPLPPQDLDLRLVRSFIAVAEHRHFGRAAATLHLTQSSLSRQISRWNSRWGRGCSTAPRRVPGSPRPARCSCHSPRRSCGPPPQATARARSAAEPSRITIGYISNLIVTPAVRELRHRYPDADVRTLHVDWDEPRAALLDHRVDAVVARLPFPTGRLHVTVLYDEPRALDPAWNAAWRIDPRPDGSRLVAAFRKYAVAHLTGA